MRSVWIFFITVFFLASCVNDDPHGKKLWEKIYGKFDQSWLQDIVLTPGGGAFLGGGTKSYETGLIAMYLVRVDEDGNPLWEKTYGGPYGQWLLDIALTPDGGALLAGSKRTNDDPSDMYLLRVDGQGNTLWEKNYGRPGHDKADRIVLTLDGGALLGGSAEFISGEGSVMTLVSIDKSGNKLWERTYGPAYLTALAVTPDGGALLGGKRFNSSIRGFDIQLYRVDERGNKLWERTFSDANLESLVITPDGGALLGGSTISGDNQGSDTYLIRVDEFGKKLWEKKYDGVKSNGVRSLVVMPDGGALLGGDMRSTRDFDLMMYLVRVDKRGNKLWEKTYSRSKADAINSLVLTPDGGALLGGRTSNKKSGTDMYLVRVENTL